MTKGNHLRSPVISGLMQTAALCPFCGARQGVDEITRVLRIERGKHGSERYYVSCWMCGATGAHDETVEGAFANWNNRPTKEWTPLAASSFSLSGGNFTTLIVHGDGKEISLVDWLDDEIHAQVDVGLGIFRVCNLKGPSGPRDEVERVQRILGEKENTYR